MMRKIFFYESTYYLFSNFSAHAIEYNGVLYKTSEHAYQATKFDDKKLRNEIILSRSPLEAKNTAYKYKDFIKKDWHDVKVKIMYEIVKTKVLQHKEVKDVLMNTKNDEIIENSPIDYFWGCGKDKTGQNQLGKILMKIRDELKK